MNAVPSPLMLLMTFAPAAPAALNAAAGPMNTGACMKVTLRACQDGRPACSNFDFSGPLEFVRRAADLSDRVKGSL